MVAANHMKDLVFTFLFYDDSQIICFNFCKYDFPGRCCQMVLCFLSYLVVGSMFNLLSFFLCYQYMVKDEFSKRC